MYAIAELRNGLVLQTTATHHHHHNQQQQQPHHQRITLHVKEGLREWKGYDHNHQSDRRDTTPNIIKLFHDLRAKLSLEAFVQLRIDAGAHDRVDAGPMRETYVDVDRRVRRVLDDIFDDGSGNDDEDDRDHDHCQHCQHCQKHGDQEDATRIVNGHDIHQPSPSPRPRSTGTPACAILVLHNRSNKSILRVMGHTPTEAHRLDFENCAALSYLVRRKRLTPTAVLARAMAEEYQWVQDRQVAEREKADRHRIAGEEIQGYRRTRDAKLWRLRDYLRFWAEGADGACEADPEAAKALVDLYALAPELKE
ncbi:hypothetical protein BD289DRAFT_447735 [Coniella lustricola]|uniref:Uncharacterized protein n=1 Tax=Coniella lustricola TaxID=2025994 RepID=A0A2T2ZSS8_9PEZI|nr:hypothetical protein BD289DRAFT_447735 [Coniella lustricola]